MNERLSQAVAAVMKGASYQPSATNHAKGTSGSSRITRMRDRHHTIARMVAKGMPDEQICSIMGMTQQSLDLLKDHTPAFQELVWQKQQKPDRELVVEEYLSTKHRLAIMAQLELADRMVEDPESFSPSELVRIIADNDDRTGYAKQTVNINVHEELGERLEGLRRRRGSPGGAGDGGGVSSLSSRDSAPPLLDLKAESVLTPLGPEVAIPPHVAQPVSSPALSPSEAETHRHLMAGRRRPIPDTTGFKRRI